jgi:hypothetical protein
METYETLERALAGMTPGNWHNGTAFYGPEGPSCYCLGGHVCRAAEDDAGHWLGWNAGTQSDAGKALAVAIDPDWDYSPGSVIAEFNDGATFQEVTDALKRAIRAEKAKAGVLVEVPAEAPQERVAA